MIATFATDVTCQSTPTLSSTSPSPQNTLSFRPNCLQRADTSQVTAHKKSSLFEENKWSKWHLKPAICDNNKGTDMETKYPELFASRSGKIARDASVLNPCSRFQKRASRVFNDLSIAPLSTPPTTLFLQSTNEDRAVVHAQDIGREGNIKLCAPIATKSFYRTFNRFARELYLERRINGEDIIGAPLLFDLNGRLIAERKLRRWTRKGGLFAAEAEMPSSCKDIRMLPSSINHSVSLLFVACR